MDKELINSRFIWIESWAFRARHQVEAGNTENVLEAMEKIQQAVTEINELMKVRKGNRAS